MQRTREAKQRISTANNAFHNRYLLKTGLNYPFTDLLILMICVTHLNLFIYSFS